MFLGALWFALLTKFPVIKLMGMCQAPLQVLSVLGSDFSVILWRTIYIFNIILQRRRVNSEW